MLPGNSRAKSHSPTSQTRPQETSIIPHSVNIPTHTLLQRSAHTGQNPAASCTSLSLSHIPQRMPGHSVSSASSTTPACRRIKAQAAPPHPCFQTRCPLPDPQGGNKNLATVRACVSPAAKARTHTHTGAPQTTRPQLSNSPQPPRNNNTTSRRLQRANTSVTGEALGFCALLCCRPCGRLSSSTDSSTRTCCCSCSCRPCAGMTTTTT